MLLRHNTANTQITSDKKTILDSKNTLTTHEKKEITRFDVDCDDSSDEDEVEDKITTYDIAKSWKKKQSQDEKKFNGRDALKNDALLSFVAHAAGIKLLYKTDVNKEYYTLKKEALQEKKGTDKPSVQLQKIAKNAIMLSLNSAFSMADKSLKQAKEKKIPGKQKIISTFSSELDLLITKKLPDLIRWLKQLKYETETPAPDAIHHFETEINNTLLSAVKKTKKISTDSLALIIKELSKSFLQILQSRLPTAMMDFQRPTLSRSHLFASTNPNSFYSNLRLSNRSQKRLALNLKNALFKSSTVSRSWRLCKDLTEETDVLETQQITSNFGRKDMLESVGNYEKVYEAILQIKEFFAKNNEEISDVHIAQWLRQIFQGTPPDFKATKIDQTVITQKLQAIAYLLFGCEATRNPAMHVINSMLLDLIIGHDDWSFEEALTGKSDGEEITDETQRMPMAPKGAVSIARKLESDYRDYLPYRYFYHGIEAQENRGGTFSKEELVEFEARIVRDWVKLNHGKSFSLSKSKAAGWLLDCMEKHSSHWIGESKHKGVITDAKSIKQPK